MTDTLKKIEKAEEHFDRGFEILKELKEEIAITEAPADATIDKNWLTREDAERHVNKHGSQFSKFYPKHSVATRGYGHSMEYFKPDLDKAMQLETLKRQKKKAAA